MKVEVAPQSTTAERVEQFAIHIDQSEKQALLTMSLLKGIESGEIDRTLVFTRTKHGADRVVRHLAAAGINAAAIHGNKTQAQRTRALDGFRDGKVPVLVATDIAARGIDVSGVSHVFNFEIPNVPEQYVHRIGRTARAGADGMAISFVAPDEKPYMRDIERLTKNKPAILPIPENFVANAAEREPNAKGGRGGGGARGGGGGGRGRSGGGGGSKQFEERQQRKSAENRGDGLPRDDMGRKRRFRPKGANGVGAHKSAVKAR